MEGIYMTQQEQTRDLDVIQAITLSAPPNRSDTGRERYFTGQSLKVVPSSWIVITIVSLKPKAKL